jgi:hypothetical protein
MKCPRRSTTFLIKMKKHKKKWSTVRDKYNSYFRLSYLIERIFRCLPWTVYFIQRSIKISEKKKKLSVICRYVEIHSSFLLNQSYNLELHLVERDSHTHIYTQLKSSATQNDSQPMNRVEDHHYRHHHCVYIHMYVC